MALKGKVALVTGAGSGIGKATAVLLAKHGVQVGALSDTADEVRETVAEIQHDGGEAMVLVADVALEESMQRAVQQVVDAWGRLDIVHANAGINGVWAPIEELTIQDWYKTIDTNLTGTFLTIKYAVPHLKKHGGNIVITASQNGTRVFSNPGATIYSTTKAGQVAMAKMLAVELAPHNIRVNVICPGATETEIKDSSQQRDVDKAKFPVEYPKGRIPLAGGKPATAKEIGQLALFLVSDEASHITGTEVWIDGGSSLIQG